MASDLGLSGLVMLGFLAAAAVVLPLARALARKPTIEIWLAAMALVVISSVLLRVLSDRGLLLTRTPALIHAGFAGLILVWAGLRRDTSVLGPPAPASVRSGAISWLASIPAGGVLLSLPSVWDLVVPQEVVALLQTAFRGAAWLAVIPVLVGGARMPSAGELPSTLAALVYRQGQTVRPDPDFHRDVDRLIQGLEHHPLLAGKRRASTR